VGGGLKSQEDEKVCRSKDQDLPPLPHSIFRNGQDEAIVVKKGGGDSGGRHTLMTPVKGKRGSVQLKIENRLD